MGLSNEELNAGEEVLVDAHPHWIVLAAPAVVTVVAVAVAAAVAVQFPKAPVAVGWVLAVMVGVPAVWLVIRTIHRFSISLVVTNQRILLQRGIMRRDVAQLRLARVREVHCTQSMGERLIGSGRLVFEVNDEEGAFVVEDVRRPRSLQRVIGARIGRPDEVEDPGAPWVDEHATPPHGMPPDRTRDVPAPAPAPAEGAAGVSVHRQLLEIDDLRRRGILTPEEFERKKADLLGRL